MVVLSDLWIGDLLRLHKSGRIGKFEGVKNGKAKVNVSGKTILSSASNLEIYLEGETSTIIEHYIEPQTYQKPFEPILDLHIENLNPSLLTNRAERIVDYQIRAAKDHIETAISRRQSTIEIIHGKGAGVLKSEVHHLLSLYKEVKHHFIKRNGGSTEVLFNF